MHNRLVSGNWKPDPYEVFFVRDPKLRKIHKATVRDRVFFQAVYRALYQIFDDGFIFHSYSSREFKGTHAGIFALEKYIRKVSKNYTCGGYVLKCDIRKFFDSIDHEILFDLIKRKVVDKDLLILIRKVIDSYSVGNLDSLKVLIPEKGLPLGNVTSQLFANVYLNELDQYTKHVLKTKYYIRYCDDFGIVSVAKNYLDECLLKIDKFCKTRLLLDLHQHKIIFCKIHLGVDFLGYVLLSHRRVLRTNTKKRMFRRLNEFNVQSYLGVLSHCKSEKLKEQVKLKLTKY